MFLFLAFISCFKVASNIALAGLGFALCFAWTVQYIYIYKLNVSLSVSYVTLFLDWARGPLALTEDSPL